MCSFHPGTSDLPSVARLQRFSARKHGKVSIRYPLNGVGRDYLPIIRPDMNDEQQHLPLSRNMEVGLELVQELSGGAARETKF